MEFLQGLPSSKSREQHTDQDLMGQCEPANCSDYWSALDQHFIMKNKLLVPLFSLSLSLLQSNSGCLAESSVYLSGIIYNLEASSEKPEALKLL